MAVNSAISYTGLVQKYIGTAYDKVALVADNMEALLALVEAIEHEDFDKVVEIADEIKDVLDAIDGFMNIYYGAYPEHPTESPTGDPIDLGDMYYNTTYDYMYVYGNAGWIQLGSREKTVEYTAVTTGHIVGSTVTIPVTQPYYVGQDNLNVYVNGVHLYSKHTDASGDYLEASKQTIEFNSSDVQAGDIVIVEIAQVTETVYHVVEIDEFIYTTLVENEQTIAFPTGYIYIPETHNLEVYLDRVIQIVDLDYLELTPEAIDIIAPQPAGTEVYIKIGKAISTTPIVPKTVFQDTVPALNLYDEGQQWFNTSTARMFILYKDADSDQWVSMTGEETIIVSS